MTDEKRETLENLVFSPHNPYLSLDARLQPFLDLIADIERAERERCAAYINELPVYNDPQDCAAAIRALD